MTLSRKFALALALAVAAALGAPSVTPAYASVQGAKAKVTAKPASTRPFEPINDGRGRRR